jgi:hypothetical protein
MGCPICDGGLSVCKVCGLIEGSLTTDCPEKKCHSIHGENVYLGLIDFVDGKWVNQCSPWSPYEHLKTEILKLTK